MSAHLDKHTKQIASAVSLAAQQADLGYILITFTAADYATLIKQLQDPNRMKGSFLHGCAGNVPREAIPLILGLVLGSCPDSTPKVHDATKLVD